MRFLIVEDELEHATTIRGALHDAGWACDVARSLSEASLLLDCHEYGAIVLDRNLGDGDGAEACASWRKEGLLSPVLMLTARAHASEVVEGLDCGADDYLPKPFDVEILLARLRALLRRPVVAQQSTLAFGELTIERHPRRVMLRGARVVLTAKEYALLEVLALANGGAVERYDLLEQCWDHAADPGSNVVNVHVAALRRKLGPEWIETVRGSGYRLAVSAQ